MGLPSRKLERRCELFGEKPLIILRLDSWLQLDFVHTEHLWHPNLKPLQRHKGVALRDVVACEDGRIWGYRVNTDSVWSWLLRVTVEVHAGGLDAAGTTGKPTSATGLIARLKHKRSYQGSRRTHR